MTDRFQIIPVLDLKAGHVVHARAGDRANYHPIRSPLVAGSAPLEVLRALLALAPISTLYIADLDAIAKTGDHRATLAELARQHPKLTFWYDGGGLPLEEAVPVLGSESLSQRAELQAAMAKWGPENFILSLDYRGDDFIGPPGLDRAPSLWPSRVILMTLARVGSIAGPDIDRLAALRAMAPVTRLFAAGGVRGRADLERLKALGMSGVLVASALHDGRLTRDDLLG